MARNDDYTRDRLDQIFDIVSGVSGDVKAINTVLESHQEMHKAIRNDIDELKGENRFIKGVMKGIAIAYSEAGKSKKKGK